jgi:hypothetical protein
MTFDDLYRAKVNISAAALGVAIIIALTRLSARLPERYYFTFEGFILNPRPEAHWISLAAKLFIPIVAGLVLGYIWRGEGKVAAAVAGFCGPSLMMWPLLTNWDVVAPASISGYFSPFILLYCLYIAASTYLCMTGALIGERLAGILKISFVAGDPIVISWSEVAKTAAKGLIAFLAEQVLHRILT